MSWQQAQKEPLPRGQPYSPASFFRNVFQSRILDYQGLLIKQFIIKYEDGKEQAITISYNALPVRLPERDYSLFLIVAKWFGKESMMLLMSCPVNIKVTENLWRIV